MLALLLLALAADTFEGIRITPIQHASLMLQAGGKTIYIDPAQGNYDGLPGADLILLTDIHGDHFQPAVIAKLRRPETTLIGPAAAAEKITGMKPMANGESRQWDAWSIQAVPMYNVVRGPASGGRYHEKGRGNGYVLTWSGKRIYIAGDTEKIPEMSALKNIGVAFVPMNLPYTMTPQEAAEAVRVFNPKVVYPYHYRGSDLRVFEKALAGSGIEVRLRNWY